jgi:hypothetical protein
MSMFSCPNPSCKKPLPALTRTCSFCRTDLSLLVDYAGDLQSALERAAALTRCGELGAAVWSYLEVLEVDPDNPAARHQVAQVAAAVRQFDQAKLARLRGNEPALARDFWAALWKVVVGIALLLVAFWIGYRVGSGDY